MARPKKIKGQAIETSAANLGFEAKLWAAADALRGSMDAAEYKHVVLGLIFLKYISDVFEEHYGYFFGNHGGMKHAHS
jgi:type I restriction enzyme M protein